VLVIREKAANWQIRNPNIEIRNKFKIQITEIQNSILSQLEPFLSFEFWISCFRFEQHALAFSAAVFI